MDEVKDKMKGLMKKVNKPFSSSSPGKFKGQGRVLGSSSSSPSSGPANFIASRPPQSLNTPKQNQSLSSSSLPSNSKPATQKLSNDSEEKIEDKNPAIRVDLDGNEKSENGFDPFNSLVTSGKRNPNGYSLKVFECPVCGKGYCSEEEVSSHVETCLNNLESSNLRDGETEIESDKNEVEACVCSYLSGNPSGGSLEVVLRLLRNIVKEPENTKFRRIRMGNPKIKDAIGDVLGGVELFEFMGFELKEESEEMWLVMDVPSEERLGLVKNVISLLEPKKVEEPPSAATANVEELVEPKKVDRQTRVFFSVSESVAAKIELPDSFYNRSAEELKREADMRKKKIEESKLLIPKSYKEKQAKAAKKRYNRTVIRIQFPDGVVLQGIFSPTEPTGALYEFVSSALKEPSLEFELLHPVLVKRRVIPHFSAAGKRNVTLEEEDLVPAALIKFKPIETDAVVFTGLCNELLEIIEPLKTDSAVPPL
ncbi:Plant UBX domain-containing protein 2 [Forsythia ovata]|uniref:Plant UBX domain-containing protein 2 n=1 Tax=Forsythia ovata TaxID=205694 RepID=A0ABD1NWD4_9LAMI